jgi:hypothetical protein
MISSRRVRTNSIAPNAHKESSVFQMVGPGRLMRRTLLAAAAGALLGACGPAETSPGGTGGAGTPPGSGGSSSGGSSATGGSGSGGLLGSGGSGSGGTGTGGAGVGGVGTGGRAVGAGGRGGGTAVGGSPGGGGSPTSVDPATFGLNGPSKCPGSAFAICEDFEATAVGANPTGWTKEGTWVTGVSADEKARGAHSLRIDVGTANNQRGFLLKTAAQLGPLATKHYGRIFFKVQNPPTQFIHWDFFHGPGAVAGGNNDVRWGFTGTAGANGLGALTYLYNVQLPGTAEIGMNSPTAVRLVYDQWICAEWLLDSTVAGGGEARFWLNGVEVPSLHRTGTQARIPVFTRYGIGWELFNATDRPSIAFIDEAVFDAQPIGCNN